MRRKTEAGELLLLAALLLFVAGLCLQPMTESDLFFRVRVGREILAGRALLGRNQFSFTAPDHPDLDLSWAFEIAVAALHRLGGFRAIVVAKTIWIVATFAGAFALCRRRGTGPLGSTLALAAAALVMRERFVERPHVVSFAGEIVVLAALAAVDRREGFPSGRRILVFAIAVVLWANMHAGVFVGVLMSLLAGVGALFTDRRKAVRAGSLAGTIALGAALTPVGPVGLARYLALHVTIPVLHPIDELRNATWRSDRLFFSWLLVGGACVAAAWWWERRLRAGSSEQPMPDPVVPASFDLSRLLPALGISVLGLSSVRFAADAALVSAPLVASSLSALGVVISRKLLRGEGRPPAGLPVADPAFLVLPRRAAIGLTAAILIAATAEPRLASARAGRPVFDVDVDLGAVPLDAIRFAEDHGLRERMYNDFETGSYLLFQGYPRYRVFVDPRLPAYPSELHQLLGSFDLDRSTWGAVMRRYGVETALLGYAGINRRVAWWDPEDWALVYRAFDARIFVRRREKWRALIAAREVPATFDFNVETGTATRPLERKPDASPVTDCEWQRRLGDLVFELDHGNASRARPYFERALRSPGCLARDDEVALAAWMGALELQPLHDGHGAYGLADIERAPARLERALAHLERALALAPGDLRTRANRATLLERLGRFTEAASDWARVSEASPGTPLGAVAAARARKLRPEALDRN